MVEVEHTYLQAQIASQTFDNLPSRLSPFSPGIHALELPTDGRALELVLGIFGPRGCGERL